MNNNIINKLNLIIVDYIKYKKDKKYKFKKRREKILKKLIFPPEINKYSKDININNFDKKFRPFIEKFLCILKDNFDEDTLKNFYNNINSLKFIEKTNKKSIIEGKYVNEKNSVVIYNGNIGPTVYHELFHMASSNNVSKFRNFVGFHQHGSVFSDFDIGKGLNEGYTEYLTKKYFEYDERYGYDFESFIASYIETIIGFDKMSKFYFKSNLKGLIKEISQYEDEEEIIKFIKCLDYYNIFCRNKKLRDNVCDCVEYCMDFVFKCFVKHLKNIYDKNLITKDELINSLNQIYDDMYFDLFENDEHFELDINTFTETIKNIFGDILIIEKQNIL